MAASYAASAAPSSSMPCPPVALCICVLPLALRTSTSPDFLSTSSSSLPPSPTKPPSTASATASSQNRWTARRRGRAPYDLEKPPRQTSFVSSAVHVTSMPSSSQRSARSSSIRPATVSTSDGTSDSKTITSSRRLRNSGRKAEPSSCLTAVRIAVYASSPPWPPPICRILLEPTLDVRTSIAFEKSMTRPLLSVSRPSSRTWRRMLKTSGWAFSTSSTR
mmetsp:Transcript_893/g.2445  ORF Transcript_893/g.2445 Transcript_893/m.2445 type:complete len:220 (+) Transcript_893:829-1488(+)